MQELLIPLNFSQDARMNKQKKKTTDTQKNYIGMSSKLFLFQKTIMHEYCQ